MLTDEQIDSAWDGLDGPKIISGSDCAEWNKQIRRAFARSILAAHSAGAQGCITFEQWAKDNGLMPKTYTSKSNPGGAYGWAKRAWEAAQPQPMTQKDAARDAKRWREKIIRAMRAPSRGDFAIEINAIVREMTDAIERLGRAKEE